MAIRGGVVSDEPQTDLRARKDLTGIGRAYLSSPSPRIAHSVALYQINVDQVQNKVQYLVVWDTGAHQ